MRSLRQSTSWLAFGVAATLMGACAPKNPSVSKDGELAAAALSATVRCGEGPDGACPEALAMLVADGAACSAFLIAPDLAVTAGTCLPADLRAAGRACDGRVKLRFAETSRQAALEVKCASVVAVHGAAERLMDYAVLSLAQPITGRTPYEISRDGPENDQNYRLPRVEWDTGAHATLRESACKPVYSTRLLPQSRSRGSSVHLVADCSVGATAAGAPLIDASGKVRAVVQAPIDTQSKEAQLQYLSMNMIEGQSSPMVRATNLACIRLPGDSRQQYEMPKDCNLDRVISVRRAADEQSNMPAAVRHALNMELATVVSGPNSGLEPALDWQLGVLKDGSFLQDVASFPSSASVLLMAVPKCVRDVTRLSSARKFVFFRVERTQSDQILPVFRVNLGVDRYYRPSAHIESAFRPRVNAVMEYSPSDLADFGRSNLTLRARNVSGQMDEIFSTVIAPCAAN